MVERIPGKRDPAPHRADIHHHAPHLPTSSARVNVSHNPHRMPRHPHRAPEVRLDAPPRVLLARVLRVPEQVVPGVVDHDVEAAEAVQGGGHGGVDRVRRSDVEGLLEKPWVVRGKVVEGRGVSGGRDEAVVRLGGYQLAEGLADAGGAAGDWMVSGLGLQDGEGRCEDLLNQTASLGSWYGVEVIVGCG